MTHDELMRLSLEGLTSGRKERIEEIVKQHTQNFEAVCALRGWIVGQLKENGVDPYEMASLEVYAGYFLDGWEAREKSLKVAV